MTSSLDNSSLDLLFGLYSSLHQRNIVCKYDSKGNQSWNKNKEIHLSLILILKNLVFLTFSENSFSATFDFSLFQEHIFLRIIKQPFRRGVNRNRFVKKCSCYYVLIIFSSQYVLELSFKGTLMQIWKSPFMFVFI